MLFKEYGNVLNLDHVVQGLAVGLTEHAIAYYTGSVSRHVLEESVKSLTESYTVQPDYYYTHARHTS